MKLSRARKITVKLILIYALVVVLIYFARQPSLREATFWIGLVPIVLGQAIRSWAAGHLTKNKELTTTGPYAYVKNPLYIGTFLIMVGFCVMAQAAPRGTWYFDHANWILLGIGILGFVAYYVPYKKKREGDRLRDIFGPAWDDYDRAVPDYFPRLTPYTRGGKKWSFRMMVENSEAWTPLAIAAGVLALVFHDSWVRWFV
ncbi:MAG TPA: isoprenylcysteine carboxylmethyltransferase family protein [Planctomycetota bacterium]|nr:isoprenylcysteine carboxylmethyltransferase family protein [Planctomycetota bacterium]